ncbi:hypothetical protein HBA54_13040 [Pelagibius litoralis]|uniref:Uncharacterized protein n=1 Tax=Pelagibius litoralis TaxID=374515 RepID=A0A967EY26_9PROT|nr:hypothetical protein [Pelagibius litoralis]NIA69520.1 hypothetical protein [Pelagibius litoralis]
MRRLLFSAARRIAQDPEVQAKAVDAYERGVKPRLSAAREELRELTGEVNPLEDPGGFARRLKDRVREVNRRK